jgi:hypothetical protein
MSTGKFTYDIVLPTDKDYPLLDIEINKEPKFGSKKISSKSKSKVDQICMKFDENKMKLNLNER